MGQIASAPCTGGKSSICKMRFSAIFVLVLVCALVVDAHFHQKKREKQRRRQLERQRSYYRPRTTTRYRPSYDRYDRNYYGPRRTYYYHKREAEAEPSDVAEPVADADAYYGFYGHGLGYTSGYPLSYTRGFYGHGLGYGRLWLRLLINQLCILSC